MPRKPIKVTVVMPTTPEGKAALHQRMIEFNSDLIGNALAKIDAPPEAKRAWLQSLGGRVPWANDAQS